MKKRGGVSEWVTGVDRIVCSACNLTMHVNILFEEQFPGALTMDSLGIVTQSKRASEMKTFEMTGTTIKYSRAVFIAGDLCEESIRHFPRN